MSRRIIRDVEEALARDVRRIGFHDLRTADLTVLQDTFDPFTGEIVQRPIDADFYDSSADTNFIQYPNFTIKLLKTREDRFTGRVLPPYGREVLEPVKTASKAFKIELTGSDGNIASAGNSIQTGSFQIRKVVPDFLLKLLTGNNKGTYTIDTVTVSNSGPHTITVKSDLVINLPDLYFDSTSRTIYFTTPVDLGTVKVGDNFVDSTSAVFAISTIDLSKNTLILGGSATPSLLTSAKISRTGNVFQSSDPSPVSFLVLDPNQPINKTFEDGTSQATDGVTAVDYQIPIDAYYLIRIDSKERQTHIDVLNRMWEEFNPPRTGLPVIVRSAQSAEQALTVDVPSGGSTTITVADNSKFNINDPIMVFDKLTPTRDLIKDGFTRPFSTVITSKVGTTQLVVADTVPDTYTTDNETLIVSNASVEILMFHFVNHDTKDIDQAQFFVHEFTFWIQLWIDRLEATVIESVIQEIGTPIEDLEGNVLIQDV